jgi:ankyrin repeat protein
MIKCNKNIIVLLAIFAFIVCVYADEIHEAARKGDLTKVKELLDKHPELVNAVDNRNCTPLHFAVNGGYTEIANLLIEKGADILAKDADGDTPLHWAAWAGKTDLAELLISKGADIKFQK